jgi:transcriptional antiterminator RfaH
MQHWYIIQTKPRLEDQVRAALERKGIEIYLPMVRVRRVNPRARPRAPFFPCYVFARADLASVGVSALQWTPGAVRVLGFDEDPAIVPDSVVEYIRQRVSVIEYRGTTGLGPFQPGDVVRITSGPFRDLEAVFDRALSPNGRSQVLIKFLGRLVRSEIDVTALEKLYRPGP